MLFEWSHSANKHRGTNVSRINAIWTSHFINEYYGTNVSTINAIWTSHFINGYYGTNVSRINAIRTKVIVIIYTMEQMSQEQMLFLQKSF